MFTNVLLAVVVLLLAYVLLSHLKSKNYPPGPFPWPFVGNQSVLKNLSRALGGQHIAFLELTKRYCSDVISLRLGTSNVVVVCGNRLIQKLLNTEELDGRPWNEFTKMRNMGMRKGITMNDGPEWKELRAWMVRTFRTVGFGKREMSELIKDELVVVLDKLKDGGVHRMKPVIGPAVINVLWTLATGKRLCEGTRLQSFISIMERRARMFDMAGGRLAMFPWLRYVAPESSGYNLLVTLNNKLKGFLMEAITEHKKKYIPGSEADLIDMFLREMFNNKESDKETIFTDDQLVMVLIDLFIAGCTTTTTSLDFLFVNMVIHQDIQKKIQQELDSVIPAGQLPDLDSRPKLPYTEAVLAESQRLYAIAPIIGPRRVLRDMHIDNYSIPKNTSVLLNIHSVHIDPKLFPEPHQFKPERFLKDGAYVADENILTFGKGKRRCPGEVLARSALFLLFVGVMQKYTLLPVPGKGPTEVEVVPGMTIAPKPYDVLIVPR